MMRWGRLGVAAAAALALALGGCTTTGAEGAPTEKTDLVVGIGLAAQTLDANNMNWGNQSIYAQAVFDTLLHSNPDGVTVEPALATEWSYNDDNTVLTLTLRDDVTFTDGVPFTADVAAQNILRFRDGSSPQRAKAAGVTGAVAIDDTTLEITLAQADPAFLIYLTQVAGLMQSPASFEAADNATNPVGSGPYVLDAADTVIGTSYVFTPNPDYWNPDIQLYNSLTVNVYTDATSMVNALRGTQLNAASLSDNTTIPQVEAAGYTVHPLFQSLIGLYLFDRGGVLTEALGDVRVRQAINYAIDSEAFLETIGGGYGNLTQQVFRPESEAWDESLDSTYSYDPEKAIELLDEAGYGDGFDLTLPTAPLLPQALTALIAQQLGEVGIRVTFVDVGSNLIPDILGAKYSASYFQLQQDPVPSQQITFMLGENATWNPFRYTDDTSAELIATISAGGDDATEAAKELNRYLTEQAWFNPWYTVQTSFVTDPQTTAEVNQGNALPNLWDITPAS